MQMTTLCRVVGIRARDIAAFNPRELCQCVDFRETGVDNLEHTDFRKLLKHLLYEVAGKMFSENTSGPTIKKLLNNREIKQTKPKQTKRSLLIEGNVGKKGSRDLSSRVSRLCRMSDL